jgi:mRNA-degrading endonuclease toxin of MazEF toxin-antitoxin module
MTEEMENAKLAALAARVQQLPKEIEPPADAWTSIEAQITNSSIDSIRSIPARVTGVWQRPAFLAAAAVFLVAASSLITSIALARFERPASRAAVVPASTARASAPRRSATPPSNLVEFSAVETDYINSANELSSVLETGQTTLSPETVAKLRKSLRIIDAAIIEARRALAADPADRSLVEMLNTSYNQKIDLLRRATEMGRS